MGEVPEVLGVEQDLLAGMKEVAVDTEVVVPPSVVALHVVWLHCLRRRLHCPRTPDGVPTDLPQMLSLFVGETEVVRRPPDS